MGLGFFRFPEKTTDEPSCFLQQLFSNSVDFGALRKLTCLNGTEPKKSIPIEF
jgi:hypothetical protein